MLDKVNVSTTPVALIAARKIRHIRRFSIGEEYLPYPGSEAGRVYSADCEFAAALSADDMLRLAYAKAETALVDFRHTRPSVLAVQSGDAALEIPGAADACGPNYKPEHIEAMRSLIRYRKKRCARYTRMREIVNAFDAFEARLAKLADAEQKAERAIDETGTSDALETVIWRIAVSDFTSDRGIALKTIVSLHLQGYGGKYAFRQSDDDRRDDYLNRSIVRDILAKHPDLLSIRALLGDSAENALPHAA